GFAAETVGAFVVRLEDRVVEDVHVAGHPTLIVGVAHLHEIAVRQVVAAAGRRVGTPGDVAPDVQRPDGGGGVADDHHRVLDVIVPDANVLVAAFRFDAVVPAVGEIIAVGVAV